MKSLPRRKKGFTLIELIMTIIIVGILFIPLSLLLSQHMQSIFQSADYSMATDLARFDMERVKNMSYANIDNASFANYQGYLYDLTRTVTYAQGDATTPESLKQVLVEVRKAGSATVLVSLVTYIARNVSYGL